MVCCRLTPVQKKIYKHLMSSKEIRHILNGKQTNILSSIGAIKKVRASGELLLFDALPLCGVCVILLVRCRPG